MSQGTSGYARKPGDLYETPEWVTRALLPHVVVRDTPGASAGWGQIWEPAAGSGKIADELRKNRGDRWAITSTDIARGSDFLRFKKAPGFTSWIITNPPYSLATEFIEHALDLMEPVKGSVAMLLRTDFDHAKSRAHLFANHPAFAKKVVLTKCITWFVEANGKPKASPSFNHAWYIWDWEHSGPPTLAYQL